MNAIPFMRCPTIKELFEYDNIPRYEDMRKIILEEVEKNNKILLVGDAACHPSETYVIIDFAEEPKGLYVDLKDEICKGKTYQYITYCDNKGALRINFRRMEDTCD